MALVPVGSPHIVKKGMRVYLGGRGKLPYKSDRGELSEIFQITPKRYTRILFSGRGANSLFTPKRNQVSLLTFTFSDIFGSIPVKGTTISLTEVSTKD